MNEQRRILKIILAVCVVIAVVSAVILYTECSLPEGSKVKAGVLLPLSGEYGSDGNSILEGIYAGSEEYDGVDYIVKDTAGDPEVALAAMSSLHESGVDIFIGPYTNAEIGETLGYAITNDLIILLPFETAGDLAEEEGNIYRVSSGPEGEALAIGSLVYDLIDEDSSVLVLYEEGSDRDSEIAGHLEEWGYTDALFMEYNGSGLVRRVAESEVPGVTVWLGSPETGGILTSVIRDYDEDAVIVLSQSSAIENFSDYSGGSVEGVFGVIPYGGLDRDSMLRNYGYDTAILLEEAVADGGGCGALGIRDQLGRNVFLGSTGIKYFGSDNSAPPAFVVLRFENGSRVIDNDLTSRGMARALAVYGGILESPSLLSDEHISLPLPHGIYD